MQISRGLITILCAFTYSIQSGYCATYKIDSDHSEVGFKVSHLAISKVNGRFAEFSGSITFDPNKIEASKAEAEIAVKSVDTRSAKRDTHLLQDDFFSEKNHPKISFISKSVKASGKDSFDVSGDLTMHGVTKPVVLSVVYTGSAKDPWGNEKAGFSATTKISRQEFGLTWNKALEAGGVVVGDEVTINLEIEGTKTA